MKMIRFKASALLAPMTIVMVQANQVALAESTGFVDVYVDHSALDKALSKAESSDVDVVRTETVVLEGDADQTRVNAETAKTYYETKAAEINQAVDTYNQELAKYNAEVTRNEEDADNANAYMSALKTNLASNNQQVRVETKVYTDAIDLSNDISAIQANIDKGRLFNTLRNEIANGEVYRDSMTDFTVQANQGNIKLNRETITVSTVGQVAGYTSRMRQSHEALQRYVEQLATQTGTVADADKPTYTLYDYVVDPTLESAVNQPVTVFNYTPKAPTIEKPIKPSLEYHLYDVRSKPMVESESKNTDDEKIVELDKAQGKVVTVIPGQTVRMATNNQPLPADRFDKFHQLSTSVHLPAGVEFDPNSVVLDKTMWTMEYNEESRIVTFHATAKQLLAINQGQRTGNGEIGGRIETEWLYDSPSIDFKVPASDTAYVIHAETMVNHEYNAVGRDITIFAAKANPEKQNDVNLDGKLVLPGTVNNYQVKWDFSQYEGVNIDREMQAKGLYLVDDFPEEAVEVTGPIRLTTADGQVVYQADISGTSGVFKDSRGQTINGLEWSITSTAPEGLEGTNGQLLVISVKGHDHELYKNYVEKGISLYAQLPMTTKVVDRTPNEKGGPYGGVRYTNKAYQSDFGNNYQSNDVHNDIVLIDPRKDAVLSFGNLSSLDAKTNQNVTEIEVGGTFKYRLSGSTLPTNLSAPISLYRMTDEFAQEDGYTGHYIIESGNDIIFKEGTVLHRRYGGKLAANSDLTRYTTQTIARDVSATLNTATGLTDGSDKRVTRVLLDFDADFLDQIDFTKTEWQVDAFLTTERLVNKDGVVNTFNEVINGLAYESNEVVTNSKARTTDTIIDEVSAIGKKQDEMRDQVVDAFGEVLEKINNKADQSTVDKLTENVNTVVNEVVLIKTSFAKVVDNLNKTIDVVNEHDKVIVEHSETLKSHSDAIRQLSIRLLEKASEPRLVTVSTVDLYLAKSEDDAKAEIKKLGYGDEFVVTLTQKNNIWSAVIQKSENTSVVNPVVETPDKKVVDPVGNIPVVIDGSNTKVGDAALVTDKTISVLSAPVINVNTLNTQTSLLRKALESLRV